jgi:hypothetical protein
MGAVRNKEIAIFVMMRDFKIEILSFHQKATANRAEAQIIRAHLEQMVLVFLEGVFGYVVRVIISVVTTWKSYWPPVIFAIAIL